MKTKVCSKCNSRKSIDQFYKDSRTADGFYNHCKTCHKAYNTANSKTLKAKAARKQYRQSEAGKTSDRRYSRSEKGKATAKRFRESDKGKTYHRAFWDRADVKQKNRELSAAKAHTPEQKARIAVNNAVKKSILPKVSTRTCVDCGRTARHYHHVSGYDEANHLNVIPLCVKCHKLRHYA